MDKQHAEQYSTAGGRLKRKFTGTAGAGEGLILLPGGEESGKQGCRDAEASLERSIGKVRGLEVTQAGKKQCVLEMPKGCGGKGSRMQGERRVPCR